jgi:hypothetical protein
MTTVGDVLTPLGAVISGFRRTVDTPFVNTGVPPVEENEAIEGVFP